MRSFNWTTFKYAWQGLRDLYAHQPNFRVHLAFTAVAVGAGFLLGIGRLEWVAIVICILLVTTAEAMNTALEYLTDLVSPGYHELAGKAKDAAAAAVLITAIGAVVVGLLVFVPRLWAWVTTWVFG